MALEQEKRVSEEIFSLFELARELKDYRAEQFLQWFVKEQVEEVALMGDLLNVVERSRENLLLAEDYIARESLGEEGGDPTAPPCWRVGRSPLEPRAAGPVGSSAARRQRAAYPSRQPSQPARLRIVLIRRNSAMSSRSAAGAGAGRKRAGSGDSVTPSSRAADPVGAGAAAGGDGRGGPFALPEQAGVVVEAVAAGHPVADRLQVGGAALGLVVVVDAEAAGEQAEAGGRQRLAGGLGDAGLEPAHRAGALAGEDDPRRQARLRIEAMSCASQTASRLTMLPPPT